MSGPKRHLSQFANQLMARERIRESFPALSKCVVSSSIPGYCTEFELRAENTSFTLHQSLPPALGGVLMRNDGDLNTSALLLKELSNNTLHRPSFPITFCFHEIVEDAILNSWLRKEMDI